MVKYKKLNQKWKQNIGGLDYKLIRAHNSKHSYGNLIPKRHNRILFDLQTKHNSDISWCYEDAAYTIGFILKQYFWGSNVLKFGMFYTLMCPSRGLISYPNILLKSILHLLILHIRFATRFATLPTVVHVIKESKSWNMVYWVTFHDNSLE